MQWCLPCDDFRESFFRLDTLRMFHTSVCLRSPSIDRPCLPKCLYMPHTRYDQPFCAPWADCEPMFLLFAIQIHCGAISPTGVSSDYVHEEAKILRTTCWQARLEGCCTDEVWKVWRCSTLLVRHQGQCVKHAYKYATVVLRRKPNSL